MVNLLPGELQDKDGEKKKEESKKEIEMIGPVVREEGAAKMADQVPKAPEFSKRSGFVKPAPKPLISLMTTPLKSSKSEELLESPKKIDFVKPFEPTNKPASPREIPRSWVEGSDRGAETKSAIPQGEPREIRSGWKGKKETVATSPLESKRTTLKKPEVAPHPALGGTEEEWTLPKQVGEEAGILPEVSLSPEKIVIFPRAVRKNLIFLLISIMIFSFIFTSAWWWTNDYLKKSLKEIKIAQEEIKTVEEEVESYLEVKKKIANIETKFGQAQRVLKNHIYWTRFFTLLEKYTVPEVFYSGFSGNTSGSIHLNGGTLSLQAVGRQMLAFKEASDFVEKAEISNITMSAQGVTFNLELILKPDIFYLGK